MSDLIDVTEDPVAGGERWVLWRRGEEQTVGVVTGQAGVAGVGAEHDEDVAEVEADGVDLHGGNVGRAISRMRSNQLSHQSDEVKSAEPSVG